MYSAFRTKLTSLSDEAYREFSMRSIPCDRPFIGVRIPDLKKLVAKIPESQFDAFLDETPVAIEEVIARGLLIARLPYDRMLKVFDSQIQYLDNWCSVDTFCAALRKTLKTHEADFLDRKVEKLLKSRNEFATRTGIVCLLDFYVKPAYLQLLFDRAESLKDREGYYVKMALAWLLAECFIKFPEETYIYIKESHLDNWTINKAISKICDSRRVDVKQKDEIKKLRKPSLAFSPKMR